MYCMVYAYIVVVKTKMHTDSRTLHKMHTYNSFPLPKMWTNNNGMDDAIICTCLFATIAIPHCWWYACLHNTYAHTHIHAQNENHLRDSHLAWHGPFLIPIGPAFSISFVFVFFSLSVFRFNIFDWHIHSDDSECNLCMHDMMTFTRRKLIFLHKSQWLQQQQQ